MFIWNFRAFFLNATISLSQNYSRHRNLCYWRPFMGTHSMFNWIFCSVSRGSFIDAVLVDFLTKTLSSKRLAFFGSLLALHFEKLKLKCLNFQITFFTAWNCMRMFHWSNEFHLCAIHAPWTSRVQVQSFSRIFQVVSVVRIFSALSPFSSLCWFIDVLHLCNAVMK